MKLIYVNLIYVTAALRLLICLRTLHYPTHHFDAIGRPQGTPLRGTTITVRSHVG